MDRRIKLATIKLLHGTIRVGRTPKCGPIYHLVRYDHTRDIFTARNVHTSAESRISVADLAQAIADGIVHPSKVGGDIYHA